MIKMPCPGSILKRSVSDYSVMNKKAHCPICNKKVRISIPDPINHSNTAKFAKHS